MFEIVRRIGKMLTHKSMENVDKSNSTTAITITVKRSKTGYGFSVIGGNPARIGRVDEDSPAERSGLCVGDSIARVNGQSVHRWTADSVGRLIRHCKYKTVMELRRARKIESIELPFCRMGVALASPVAADRIGTDSPTNFSCADSESKLNRTESGCGTTTSLSSQKASNCEDLVELESFRQQALRRLVRCEEDYIRAMNSGHRRFALPLHDRLTDAEHTNLFQNMDKLCEFSVFYLRQLKLNSLPYIDMEKQSDGFIDSPGFIYMQKLQLLCESYGLYCSNLEHAKVQLTRLLADPCFRSFLQKSSEPESCGQYSIEEYLILPHQHIWQLLVHLQSVLMYTSLQHPDYTYIDSIVLDLRVCCTSISEYMAVSACSSPSIISSSSSGGSDTDSSIISHHSETGQMAALQKLIVFPKHIEPIQLESETRRHTFTGLLEQCQLKNQRTVHAILFSDILLVTKREEEMYIVLEEPIYLTDIIYHDYNRPNNLEFQLIWRLDQADDYRSIVLKADNTDIKYWWRDLLHYPISAKTSSLPKSISQHCKFMSASQPIMHT